ncbi:hypothetical protein SAMN04489733_8122 [Amycolatopsis keratiniphila]|nr:hypothetical protein SAMN04489733_8122 [Amycolatopsis keratiniphila]
MAKRPRCTKCGTRDKRLRLMRSVAAIATPPLIALATLARELAPLFG